MTQQICYVVMIPTMYVGDSGDILSIHLSRECAHKALNEYNHVDGPNFIAHCNPQIIIVKTGKTFGISEAILNKDTKL